MAEYGSSEYHYNGRGIFHSFVVQIAATLGPKVVSCVIPIYVN